MTWSKNIRKHETPSKDIFFWFSGCFSNAFTVATRCRAQTSHPLFVVLSSNNVNTGGEFYEIIVNQTKLMSNFSLGCWNFSSLFSLSCHMRRCAINTRHTSDNVIEKKISSKIHITLVFQRVANNGTILTISL